MLIPFLNWCAYGTLVYNLYKMYSHNSNIANITYLEDQYYYHLAMMRYHRVLIQTRPTLIEQVDQ